MSYHKCYWKLRSKTLKGFIQFNIVFIPIRMSFHGTIAPPWNYSSMVILFSFVCAHMSLVRQYSSILFYMSFVCHPYMLACKLYDIQISLVCHPYVTRMSSVCYSHALVCHPCHSSEVFYHESVELSISSTVSL